MKKNSIFCIFFIFFFFLCFNYELKAETEDNKTSGTQLCQEILNYFNSLNLKSEIQPLILSEKNIFPFNIKLSFPADPILIINIRIHSFCFCTNISIFIV